MNNTFPGVQFNAAGQHVFHDITLVACGTFNDLYNNRVGAIDLLCTNVSGTRVQNVKLYNIDVIDAKSEAVYFNKSGGDGFYNIVFENISIIGTGKEYPYNNANNSTAQRGMFFLRALSRWFRDRGFVIRWGKPVFNCSLFGEPT